MGTILGNMAPATTGVMTIRLALLSYGGSNGDWAIDSPHDAHVILAIGMVMPPAGDTLTGLELLRQCEGRSPERLEALGPILCVTYLSGIIDGYQFRSWEADLGRRALCPPAAGIENEQMQLVVQKWLRDHPADLAESARVSVIVALAQAFPCKR